MGDNKTSISLTWNAMGRIQHEISGLTLPSPQDNVDLWVLAPNAPFLIANRFGALRPSYGLRLCSQVLEIMNNNNYLLTPINPDLRSARIDFIYRSDHSIGILFFYDHPLFYNNDNLEEGTCQLAANYFYCVFNHFSEYYKLLIKTNSCLILDTYFQFLEDIVDAGVIVLESDSWSIEFSKWSAYIVQTA